MEGIGGLTVRKATQARQSREVVDEIEDLDLGLIGEVPFGERPSELERARSSGSQSRCGVRAGERTPVEGG